MLQMLPLVANIILMLRQVEQKKNWLAGKVADYSPSISNSRSSGIPVSEPQKITDPTPQEKLLQGEEPTRRPRARPSPCKNETQATKEAQDWAEKTWHLFSVFISDTQFADFGFIKGLGGFCPPLSTKNKNTALQNKFSLKFSAFFKHHKWKYCPSGKVTTSVPYRGEGDKKKRKIQLQKKLLPVLRVLFVKSMVIRVYLKFHQ